MFSSWPGKRGLYTICETPPRAAEGFVGLLVLTDEHTLIEKADEKAFQILRFGTLRAGKFGSCFDRQSGPGTFQ